MVKRRLNNFLGEAFRSEEADKGPKLYLFIGGTPHCQQWGDDSVVGKKKNKRKDHIPELPLKISGKI